VGVQPAREVGSALDARGWTPSNESSRLLPSFGSDRPSNESSAAWLDSLAQPLQVGSLSAHTENEHCADKKQ
jgi:hypothetical protein